MSTAAARTPLRLLVAAASNSGRLDGAWWPQSRDLTVEFADLADHLPTRLGRIVDLVYTRSVWSEAPTWLPVGHGRRVRSRTFQGTADPDRVLLRLDSHRSLELLVVPPELDEQSAGQAMRAAASAANRRSARALLADAGAATRNAHEKPG